MALFPREPADALRAGVELQRALVKYNEGRKKAGYEPVRIGIGLHCGELIIAERSAKRAACKRPSSQMR